LLRAAGRHSAAEPRAEEISRTRKTQAHPFNRQPSNNNPQAKAEAARQAPARQMLAPWPLEARTISQAARPTWGPQRASEWQASATRADARLQMECGQQQSEATNLCQQAAAGGLQAALSVARQSQSQTQLEGRPNGTSSPLERLAERRDLIQCAESQAHFRQAQAEVAAGEQQKLAAKEKEKRRHR